MKVSKEKLRIILAEQQLTVGEAAVKCGLSRSRLHSIMNSDSVTPKTVGRVADGLRVKPLDIIETN